MEAFIFSPRLPPSETSVFAKATPFRPALPRFFLRSRDKTLELAPYIW